MVKFNEYLKKCRQQNGLTQEDLVHALYLHDTEYFEALETTTLSKWERGVTKPKLAKQVSIMRYFQQLTGKAVPCFDAQDIHETETYICNPGVERLLGKSKELILNFPSSVISKEDLCICQLRNSPLLEQVLEINIDIDKDFNHNTSKFRTEQLREWALHPSNSFYVCEYKEQFFGLLFTLRLKPESFNRLMNLTLEERELTNDDFASFNEPGCSYIVSFFALNEKAAALLFMRYYAHIIANQDNILEVGLATMMNDAKRLIQNMNLNLYKSKYKTETLRLYTYKETLSNFLTSEEVVKMLLTKQDCPEE